MEETPKKEMIGGKFAYYASGRRAVASCDSRFNYYIDIPIAGQLTPGTYEVKIAEVFVGDKFSDVSLVHAATGGTHRQRIFHNDTTHIRAINSVCRMSALHYPPAGGLVGRVFMVTLAYQAGRYRIAREPSGYVMMVDDKRLGVYATMDDLRREAEAKHLRQAFIEVVEYEYAPGACAAR